ncbi:DUF4148 domain-containing protein [Thauera sp. Sel9]|uniref:DUF4148 domain-containing protein n=1 Tax=Thauera sp. Sel9 TaxID=2974299 RepID=UPI0021E1AA37|nr:DUF4148 domain-containing protein [Thauera sp. Sel9]MCV2216285.1 DUF4148 domain-containing protein [Thauera sp. Sel9]
MSKARTSTLVSLLAAACLLPGTALADSDWHVVNGEHVFVNHVKSTKTRADVMRELEQAKADGSYLYVSRGLPVPSRHAGPGKTRQEVLDELKSIPPSERVKLRGIYVGS